jgi:hypothetical protein
MMNGEEAVLVRIRRAERDIEKLDDNKAELRDLNALTEEVRSLRKAVVAFAFSIAGSAIVFALTVLYLQGGAG